MTKRDCRSASFFAVGDSSAVARCLQVFDGPHLIDDTEDIQACPSCCYTLI